MGIAFDGVKRRALAVVVVVAAAVLLSAIPSVEGAHAKPLRVGVSRSAHSSLIYVAEAQGFFKKQGLDVIIKEYELSLESVKDLEADKVDIATAGEFAFVMRSFRRRELRIPAVISKASDMDLIVRKDRGIARPQDLKGKRVAVVRGGQAEFFLYNYLIFNRLPTDSVQIVYHTPSEMLKSMADGTIDAALCWPPHTTQMVKQLGATGARWQGQSGQEYYQALFSKEGFLKNRSETIEQFLAALLEAEGYIARYPDRAQAILSQRLRLDTEFFHATWSLYRFQLQLTQDLIVLMEREAKWAMRNNLLEKREVPNYLDFFYFDALDKVKPEAVTIVH